MKLTIKKGRLRQIIKEEVSNYNLDKQSQKLSFVNSLLDRVVNSYIEIADGDREEAFEKLIQAVEERLEDTAKIKLV